MVQLEDLAQNFKMTTQEAVHRINSLELNKMLTGVIDERGKYIYITQQEFEAVMNYIKIKGRVNKADLLQECNNLIKLDPSESVRPVCPEVHFTPSLFFERTTK